MDEISHRTFAQLDHVITEQRRGDCVLDSRSHREVALASHHFLLTTVVNMRIEKTERKIARPRVDWTQLRDPQVARAFAIEFVEARERTDADSENPSDNQWKAFAECAQLAAGHILPKRSVSRNRPWIQSRTLALIEERNAARHTGDYYTEMELNKKIRQSAKSDRRDWLNRMLIEKDWTAVRRLTRGCKRKQGRLKDSEGRCVDSEHRAETLADYYENVQWAVRPGALVVERQHLGEELNVNIGPISYDEIATAASKMRSGRASGVDDLPAEVWKALLAKGSSAAIWITDLCNDIMSNNVLPKQWHLARVAAIFKSGDDGECKNYRPISLLCTGYKLYAQVLLNRLKAAGAEDRIRATQFGFKSGVGTADAFLAARCMMDAAWSSNEGSLLLLALDWAKAFDSVSADALCNALLRFGVPAAFVDLVRAIYTDRTFYVQDGEQQSAARQQRFGISQGCPLSSFLFVIVMTTLLHDAESRVVTRYGEGRQPYIVTRDLLYADDTLIIENDPAVAQYYMDVIAELGAEYGLSLHWGKVKLLKVNHEGHLYAPSGDQIEEVDSLRYLGAVLHSDARHAAELSRRLGAAQRDFNALEQMWRHASLTKTRKVEIFNACVVAKLLYGVQTFWLNVVDQRRLNVFQARCLRKTLGIPHSYLSRITNASVLAAANARPLSVIVLERQLLQFGRIARMPNHAPIRRLIFRDNSVEAQVWHEKRRRGRSRATWARQVHMEALRIAGGDIARLQALLQNNRTAITEWRTHIKTRA